MEQEKNHLTKREYHLLSAARNSRGGVVPRAKTRNVFDSLCSDELLTSDGLITAEGRKRLHAYENAR